MSSSGWLMRLCVRCRISLVSGSCLDSRVSRVKVSWVKGSRVKGRMVSSRGRVKVKVKVKVKVVVWLIVSVCCVRIWVVSVVFCWVVVCLRVSRCGVIWMMWVV